MMKILALVAALTVTACTDTAPTAPDAGSSTFVEAACGLPPDGPGYATEYTTDKTGAEVVILPAGDFKARMAWEDAMGAYALCALNAGRGSGS